MSYLIKKDNQGHTVYLCNDFLTSSQLVAYDNLLTELKKDIPKIEAGLSKEYGNTVLYKYFLGKCLADFLSKYQVTEAERRLFWDEIKNFASKEKRIRNEGSKAKTRSFYEQCYVLSQYDINVVQKLSWRQWQDLLDRVTNREDKRIFEWLSQQKEKIREDDWRDFEKALNLYLKTKDTSVFTTDELFDIYNSLLKMVKFWRISFAKFSKDFPNSMKIKTEKRRVKKYYSTCFTLKKSLKKSLDDYIFSQAFDEAMK